VTDTFLQSLHPEDVVHQRDMLLRWWSIPGEWQHDFALQGRHPMPGWVQNRPDEAEGTRKWIEGTIRQAELYWVSPEMTEVITTLAPSIPDCLPQPPVEDALVMFAKSVPGTDAETGTEIHTSAILWGTVNMWRGQGQESIKLSHGTAEPCIAAETYAWRELVGLFRGMTSKQQKRFMEIYPNRLMPTGGSEWPMRSLTSEFDILPAEKETARASIIEDRKLLATFWALASQKIVIETRERPYSRQVLRQAERKGHELPDIRVIRLREPTSHGTGERQSGVDWSHRWIVGTHWRNQWYPSRAEHRPKLIEAYQKGPEDKPLKLRPTVRALVR